MCGIIGYVGKQKALPIVLNGLKTLEYRGYDSAGMAYIKDNKVKIIKEKGKIFNLEERLNLDEDTNVAIGHTRWATHGEPSITNSHPHRQGSISLVHNGIIENYESLRKDLEKQGYEFVSETDSEVAAALIDSLYAKKKDMIKALDECKKLLKGAYAFAIVVDGDNDHLYALRKDSPLIIGVGEEENFFASDVPAILKYTNKYYLLDNDEVACINKDKVSVFRDGKSIEKEIQLFEYGIDAAEKEGYEHFMLKEINEEPKVVSNLIHKYIENNEIDKLPDLRKYKCIDIVACGSAYHSGLVGKSLIEEYGSIPVNVDIASEYRYKKLFLNKDTLVIVISQSGETADTLACLRLAKESGCDTLGIVNVVGSSIAREVDNVIYINAGCEIAVATTKAYILQILVLSLIAYKLGVESNKFKRIEIDKYYLDLPNIIKDSIDCNYEDIANMLFKREDVFFIGRNIDYYNALEGSLKLKEISYIHSETYPAGELKHGSISLIEDGTPVISLVTTESVKEKIVSNIKEVKARGALSIILSPKSFNINGDYCDSLIEIGDTHPLVRPIVTIIPLQLIAYEVAKLRCCDIDKPRNLAKSVTVE